MRSSASSWSDTCPLFMPDFSRLETYVCTIACASLRGWKGACELEKWEVGVGINRPWMPWDPARGRLTRNPQTQTAQTAWRRYRSCSSILYLARPVCEPRVWVTRLTLDGDSSPIVVEVVWVEVGGLVDWVGGGLET